MGSPTRSRRLPAQGTTLLAGLLAASSSCAPAGTGGDALRELTLAPEAQHVIPDESPAGEYVLGRIHQPRMLPGGRIGVADRTELLVVDLQGRVVQRFGRPGDGPGEFRFIATWAPCADGGVLVFDVTHRRYTRIDPAGAPRIWQSTDLPGLSGLPVALSCGEQLILGTSARVIAPPGTGEQMGRSDLVVLRAASDLSAADTLAVVEGGHDYLGLSLPFGATVSTARLDDAILHGFTADTVLHLVPGEGTPRTVTLTGLPPARAVTAAMRAERYAYSERVTPASIWNAELKAIFDAVPWPASVPRWEQVIRDDEGRFWVSEYVSVHEVRAAPRRWFLFSPAGELAGVLALPPTQELFAVRDALAWVVDTAADETRSLRGYPLLGVP